MGYVLLTSFLQETGHIIVATCDQGDGKGSEKVKPVVTSFRDGPLLIEQLLSLLIR